MNALDRERLRRLKAEESLRRARAELRRIGDVLDAVAGERNDALDRMLRMQFFVDFIARGLIGVRATQAEIDGLVAKWSALFEKRHPRTPDVLEAAFRGLDETMQRLRRAMEDPDENSD